MTSTEEQKEREAFEAYLASTGQERHSYDIEHQFKVWLACAEAKRMELAQVRTAANCLQNEVNSWTKWHEEQPWLQEIIGYQKQLEANIALVAQKDAEIAELKRAHTDERHKASNAHTLLLDSQSTIAARDKRIGELDKPIELPAQTIGDGTSWGPYSVFARGWNGCLQSVRRLNPSRNFHDAILDESREFHRDMSLQKRFKETCDALTAAQAEVVELRKTSLPSDLIDEIKEHNAEDVETLNNSTINAFLLSEKINCAVAELLGRKG